MFLDASGHGASYNTMEIAQRMGYSIVFVTENKFFYEQLPQNLLEKTTVILDVNGYDAEAIATALSSIPDIKAIVALDDRQLLYAATVSERLHLPSCSTIALEKIMFKHAMLEALQSEPGVPRFAMVTTASSNESPIGYPCIVKPIDGKEYTNIKPCANHEEYIETIKAIHEATVTAEEHPLASQALVEEYVEGVAFNAEIFWDSAENEWCIESISTPDEIKSDQTAPQPRDLEASSILESHVATTLLRWVDTIGLQRVALNITFKITPDDQVKLMTLKVHSDLKLRTVPVVNVEAKLAQEEIFVRKVALDDQKKTIIVLRSGEIFENWPNIKREFDCNYVMIGTPVIMDILRQNDWIDLFDFVVSTENFEFMNIRKLLEGNLPATCLNDIKFVTANEDMLLVCAELDVAYHSTHIPSEYTDYYLNKDKMKQRIAPEHLPKYIAFNPNQTSLDKIQSSLAAQGMQFPVFVKPTNGSSSRNVKKCHTDNELAFFLEEIKSSQEQFEIDEFISGDLYHCDSIIQDGRIVATMIGRYYAPCADFLYDVLLGSFPVLESDPLFSRIEAFSAEILSGLPQLENFVTHMELFVQGEKLTFLEVAARPPGARVCEMYEEVYGVNIIDCAFRTQLGMHLPEKTPTGSYAAWFNVPIKAGTVTQIIDDSFFQSFNSKCIPEWYIKAGQTLSNPVGLWSLSASIFLTNSNLEQLAEDYATISKTTLFQTTKVARLIAQQRPVYNAVAAAAVNDCTDEEEKVPSTSLRS
ncbi:MAG: ATP-grasp domain-containing protein [Gammaproteobacteria bacterium]|nr:ATP-grasp domain-containing protein [Gammaproteobacteria bacterium]